MSPSEIWICQQVAPLRKVRKLQSHAATWHRLHGTWTEAPVIDGSSKKKPNQSPGGHTYLRISFFTSRSSSSWSFWMKLLRTGISNFMYWATWEGRSKSGVHAFPAWLQFLLPLFSYRANPWEIYLPTNPGFPESQDAGLLPRLVQSHKKIASFTWPSLITSHFSSLYLARDFGDVQFLLTQWLQWYIEGTTLRIINKPLCSTFKRIWGLVMAQNNDLFLKSQIGI